MATKIKKTKLAGNRHLSSLSKAWLPGAILFAVVFVVGGAALLKTSQASAYCKDHTHYTQSGSSGSCVVDLQEMVNGMRYANQLESGLYAQKYYFSGEATLTVDGQFGSKTLANVKDAQRLVGLTGSNVDGVVGPDTWYRFCTQTSVANMVIIGTGNAGYKAAVRGHNDACARQD